MLREERMSLTPVKSSNIAAVGYDADAQHLTVQFKDGVKHRYENVPPEKHAAMMGHGVPFGRDHSVGKYFHANIKGAHKSKKLED